jgi:hypothetical protein
MLVGTLLIGSLSCKFGILGTPISKSLPITILSTNSTKIQEKEGDKGTSESENPKTITAYRAMPTKFIILLSTLLHCSQGHPAVVTCLRP